MGTKLKFNIQDQMLYTVKQEKKPIKIYLVRGLLLQGRVLNFDNFTILIEGKSHTQLIYKHAISTIDFPPGVTFNPIVQQPDAEDNK